MRKMLAKSVKSVAALAVAASLSGSAVAGDSPNDPAEGFNRAMFAVNEGLDTVIAKPLAKGYDYVAPLPVKVVFGNFFSNIADLMIDNDDRYQMVIVGGSAFILLGKLTRATHDIDALSVPKELYGLLGKYDINTDVEAYIDNFPYNFQDRLQPLPFGGTKVQFYTPSLEDLVIAKLCSFRDTDKADVESEAVRNSLDWNLLEHLATDEDELKASILNDWRYRDFYIRYQEYVERWRP